MPPNHEIAQGQGDIMPSATTGSPTNVLVVEDEMVLRMRAVDIVEDAGFTAVEAVNADEALSILEERSDIALLFSDIQMPGSMDGLKLAYAVHARWPAIKIILVSGQIELSDTDKPANSLFFNKPLVVKQMIAQLRAMVGQGALKIVPEVVRPPAIDIDVPSETKLPEILRSATQEGLTAENDNLRLLLEQAGIDAKEREAADKLQKLILEELHHRIKNTLATVSAIASQSLRTATSIEHGQQAIEGRLIALGRAHDLLLQASWANASFAETVGSAIKPYESHGASRFSIDGPDIGITSSAVIALALTLNELCTNTTKFGALSVANGRISITWMLDELAQRLKLTWTETGGPAVDTPTRRSFGTRMMESLGRQLSGQVLLAYRPTGFAYTLDAPLSAVTAKSRAAA